MRPLKRVVAATIPLALVLFVCGFASDTLHIPDVPIVVTSAPVYQPLAALRGADRFPKGAQLLLVRNGKAEQLIHGFAATADANVSFDATTVLFAGKKTATDPWQVWELKVADRSVRQVTTGAGDCVRPLYLPGEQLVYARRTAHGFQIETAQLDGKKELPITYVSASALPADVLADGRILFESGFPLGSGSTPEMFLMYSDGSGVESYRCDHGTTRWGGRQLASGDVVFTHGATLARFTSPLAHEQPIVAPHAEFAGAISEFSSGAWLVSARTGPAARYALKVFAPGNLAMQSVFAQTGNDIVEPVLLAPRNRPNQHPSALHDWHYANLLVLDARQSREGDLKTTPAKVCLETMDAFGHAVVIGTSPVEADGSFFVSTPSDKAIRFALLDKRGATLRQEHGWFWIRSGEQRICVGCHTGPERASENRVPAVLLRTTTPFDLTGAGASGAGKRTLAGGR
jgi:hypothetical protein